MVRCPTCGRGDDRLPELNAGQRVRHKNGYVGKVIGIEKFQGDDCIVVEFTSDTQPTKTWRGAYDASWFRIHEDGLTKID